METPTTHAAADRNPSAFKAEKRRAYAASLVAGLYVLLAIGAPLIVRYGPDTEPALITLSAHAPVQHAVAPRCATAPEYGMSCLAEDTLLD